MIAHWVMISDIHVLQQLHTTSRLIVCKPARHRSVITKAIAIITSLLQNKQTEQSNAYFEMYFTLMTN